MIYLNDAIDAMSADILAAEAERWTLAAHQLQALQTAVRDERARAIAQWTALDGVTVSSAARHLGMNQSVVHRLVAHAPTDQINLTNDNKDNDQ